jgi:16S rRNA processing protein RimM
MGHVGVPFGIRGWIKVHAYTESGDGLLDYPVWWLGRNGQWREFKVLDGAQHPKSLVARLAGCDDREAAALLRGSEIAVPREYLPQTDDGEYYWADLIGLGVENIQHQPLGQVTGLLETGANDVLVVRQGEHERLIPFVDQVVLEVDIDAGKIRVDWGLDW